MPRGYLRIGDDVAVAPVGGKKLVLKVDMLVERTDVPPGMTFRQAARKAVAMCVSDFAAKGVKPDSFMVSLGLPRGTTDADVELLGRGFRDAEEEWGVHLVGGDTNEAGELVIDCVMAGFGSKVVERRGAKPGDIVVVTGDFGFPPAGLKILGGKAKARPAFRRIAVDSVLMPRPMLGVGLALAPHLTSSMDSSDGLARSLHELADSSGVGIELSSLPVGDGVEQFAHENGLNPRDLVLAGGEEYVIVATVKRRSVERARAAARKARGKLTTIGRVTGKAGEVVLRDGRGLQPIPNEGWMHLA